MAVTIPSTSIVTSAMVTDWMTRFGRTSDQATTDLLNVETASMELPQNLPATPYTDLINAYYGALDRKPTSSRGRIPSLSSIITAVIVSAIMAPAMLWLGGLNGGVGTTGLTNFQHVTSTVDVAALPPMTGTTTQLAVNGDLDDSVNLARWPIAWGATTNTVMAYAFMSASGTATVTFFNFSTGTVMDLNSGVIGLDIWKHN